MFLNHDKVGRKYLYHITVLHMPHQSQFDVVHKDTAVYLQACDVIEDKRVKGVWTSFLDLVGCELWSKYGQKCS